MPGALPTCTVLILDTSSNEFSFDYEIVFVMVTISLIRGVGKGGVQR